MKKRDLSIIALWIWSATQCFGQSLPDPNGNTTYGGIVQDQSPSSLGQFVPNPTPNGGSFNSAFGLNALGSPTNVVSGQANCAFGFQALTSLTSGGGNTGIGANALMSLQNIFQNTSTGQNSLQNLTGGGNNSAYGYNSMFGLGTGTWNCAFGIGTMLGITSGDNNTAIGGQSQNGIAGSSSDNTSVGFRSLFSPAAGSQFNTAIGEQAMYSPLGSVLTNNTAVGYQALFTSGGSGSANNTAIGHQALFSNQSGSNNTALGFLADVTSGTLTNATAIGANAKVANNNSMELGDNSVNVGIGLSGITPGPQNKLEIHVNSVPTVTSPNAATSPPSFGASGLRFRKMNSTTPTIANPGTGVLSVDNNGDVIYVNAPSSSSCCLGSYCGTSPNPLTGSYQVPLNGHTMDFTSHTLTPGSRVNIGFAPCGVGVARLNVQTDIHRAAGGFVNNNGFVSGFQTIGVGGQATSTSTNAVGVKGDAINAPTGHFAIGVEGQADNASTTATRHVGVHGYAANGVTESVGGLFQIIPGTSPSGTNVAVRGRVNVTNSPNAWNIGGAFTSTESAAFNGNKTFGVIGSVELGSSIAAARIATFPAGISIGVYGFNPQTSSPAVPNKWAGYFDGDVVINGSQPASTGTNAVPPPLGPYALSVNGNAFTSAGTWYGSDRRFKNNIKPMTNVLENIRKIKSYNYTFNTSQFKEKNFNTGNQIGFIAQELKEVYPELVREDQDGYLAVNYIQVIPILLQAINEQEQKMDQQQQQINELKAMVQAMAGMPSGNNAGSAARSAGNTAVAVSDKNIIVLNQNSPNPFSESTVISYNIPNDFTKAQISISTIDGRLIQIVNITAKGQGSITVFASDLSAGTYTYTLTVDGKVIDTKKMMKD